MPLNGRDKTVAMTLSDINGNISSKNGYYIILWHIKFKLESMCIFSNIFRNLLNLFLEI